MPASSYDQPPVSPDAKQPANTSQTNNTHKQEETVIVLDWDDTLLASSYLAAYNIRLDSAPVDLALPADPCASLEVRQAREVAEQMRELEQCVYALLQASLAKAQRTIIVTNAEHMWVQLSAQRFMPSILPLLESISIISARSCFEHLFPDAPLKWKFYAMHACLVGSGFFGVDGRASCTKHVISLGDSHVEREAVRALCKNVPSTHTKSVKFSERPTAEQLRRQLELVVQCFGYITTHSGDLDLQLTVTMGAANTAPNATAAAAPAAQPEPVATTAAPSPSPSLSLSADSPLLTSEVKQSNSPTSSESSKKLQLDSSYAPMVVEA